MRITMEKIQQFVGLKFGEDVAKKLKNRAKVVLPPPEHSAATKARHVGYEKLIRTQQSTLLTAMQAQLKALQDAEKAAIAAAAAALTAGIVGRGGCLVY
jgi:actin-like ATPase involved in cell morphogenesis